MNPNWIRTTIASILLAILLKAGLHVPFLTTLVAIATIYVTHVVRTEMGSGITTAWGWAKSAGNVGLGVVIFLAIRFFVASVLGLYPIDTYKEIDNAGGLFGILPSHDVSKIILWEIMFAFVAGQITVMWVNGTHKNPVRAIILTSLLILTLQVFFPSYAKTWPNREAVSTNLVRHGVVGTAAIGTWRLAFGTPTEPTQSPTAPAMVKPGKTVEALVVRFEGKTPCSTTIAWPFRIERYGQSLTVQYPGIAHPITYFGEYDTNAPTRVDSGEFVFTSPDTNHPNVRVRVYEKVKTEQKD